MKEIVRFYEQSAEAERLRGGSGLLELARTQEILKRYLPAAPARLLDIGGGPGVYAGWLTGLGYEVYLLDPVPKHLEQARAYPLAGIEQGDARALPCADASVQGALMMGPLYHLVDADDRRLALREAWRALEPGGLLFASAINRSASLLHSLVDGFLDDEAFWPILLRDLEQGIHINDSGEPRFFTTAVFHTAQQLRAEVEGAGFAPVEVLPVEGPAWLAKDFDERWRDEARRERLLTLARKTEGDQTLLGVSLHLLAIGRKPR